MIKTVQIRIIAPDERTARLAIEALQNSVGHARVALTSPRQGRRGDEYLTYGTLQVDDETTITTLAPVPPATGKPAKKRPAPKARNVVTPDDIGSQGVFIQWDAHAKRYYAAGVVGPLTNCIGEPYVRKSDAEAQARRWIGHYQRTGQVPQNWPGGWRPAPNQPRLQPTPRKAVTGRTTRLAKTGKTTRLRRKP